MLSQFTSAHIRKALLLAVTHAEEIGTDREIAEARYALQLLDNETPPSFVPNSWYADQVERFGAE